MDRWEFTSQPESKLKGPAVSWNLSRPEDQMDFQLDYSTVIRQLQQHSYTRSLWNLCAKEPSPLASKGDVWSTCLKVKALLMSQKTGEASLFPTMLERLPTAPFVASTRPSWSLVCYQCKLEVDLVSQCSRGAHMLRLFMSSCKQHNLSCGVVSLDIRTAYYKVLRELVTSQPVPEDRIRALLTHFRLPAESMHQLEKKLRGDDGILRTGLGSSMGQILGELHSDTWFTTQGLPGLTVTTIGTGPGSCFADVFFNFLFAEVLKEIKATLGDSGVLTELRWCGKRSLDMDTQNEDCTAHVLETAWADDLALFFQHQDPNQLVSNLQEGCTTMINTCMRYGLEPNFARGKTEVILSLRGKGAVHARRKWFTEERGLLPLPDCHLESCHIKLVARYRHLGGIVDAKANPMVEVKARVGQMKQTFRRYKETLFASTSIDKLRRAQLLRPLVLSILEFNLVDMKEADYRYIATSILSIYRAILIGSRSGDPDEYKAKWARICYTLQLPTPMAIVHMARIRYFGQVFRAGGDDLWAAISGQRTWLDDCRKAFQWLYAQICNTSTLPDPAVDWQPWEAMLSTQKKRFAGIVQRAWRHEIIQDYNQCIVQEGYTGFYMALELGNYEFPDSITTAVVPQEPPDHNKVHACLQCQKVFGSRTAWASHAFKKHQRKNPARRFTCGTYCLACGKEFWEYKRLLMHHKYSGECRRRLAMASYTVQDDEIVPGMGSRAQRQQPEDILQPWTSVPSADLPVRNYWAGIENSWDSELLDALFIAIPLERWTDSPCSWWPLGDTTPSPARNHGRIWVHASDYPMLEGLYDGCLPANWPMQSPTSWSHQGFLRGSWPSRHVVLADPSSSRRTTLA